MSAALCAVHGRAVPELLVAHDQQYALLSDHQPSHAPRRVSERRAYRRLLACSFFNRPSHLNAYAAGVPQREQEPPGLLIDWRDGELESANYFLISLPESWTKRQLIRLVMQRWRTERVYEDLKGELGLDHCEGRRFPGWHHHVSVALCCYAFLVAERTRRFPPSARRAADTHAQSLST